LMEAYSQTLCSWVDRKAGEWKGYGRYNENESEMRDRRLQVKEPEKWRQLVVVIYSIEPIGRGYSQYCALAGIIGRPACLPLYISMRSSAACIHIVMRLIVVDKNIIFNSSSIVSVIRVK